ncbi:hypothetical protein C0J52_20948 [Blattella germanica]|nr:hypothetical protein C0J52_20948 [Blattella germanica]
MGSSQDEEVHQEKKDIYEPTEFRKKSSLPNSLREEIVIILLNQTRLLQYLNFRHCNINHVMLKPGNLQPGAIPHQLLLEQQLISREGNRNKRKNHFSMVVKALVTVGSPVSTYIVGVVFFVDGSIVFILVVVVVVLSISRRVPPLKQQCLFIQLQQWLHDDCAVATAHQEENEEAVEVVTATAATQMNFTVKQMRLAANMATKDGPELQQIDLTKLNLQQLTNIKQTLDQEISVFQESLQTLKMAQTKFQDSGDSLEKITPETEGKTIMVPLTGSVSLKLVYLLLIEFKYNIFILYLYFLSKYFGIINPMYVPGKLADTKNVIIDIGTGYFVTKVRLQPKYVLPTRELSKLNKAENLSVSSLPYIKYKPPHTKNLFLAHCGPGI